MIINSYIDDINILKKKRKVNVIGLKITDISRDNVISLEVIGEFLTLI